MFSRLRPNGLRPALPALNAFFRVCSSRGTSAGADGDKDCLHLWRTCTCGVSGAGRHRWEQEKLEARKMLENAAVSRQSGAPMLMASDHFIRENGDLRSENAALGGFAFRTLFVDALSRISRN